MKNIFGTQVPLRAEILTDEKCRNYLRLVLAPYLEALGVDAKYRPFLIRELLELASIEPDDYRYEELVHRRLVETVRPQVKGEALADRAARIFKQLKSHLLPGKILDYGCGDGRVAKLIQDYVGGVVLADTYQSPQISKLGMPFVMLEQNKACHNLPSGFDNILLITVLHHCDNPMKVLNAACHATRKGGRLLIVESVYGISMNFGDPSRSVTERAFLKLDASQQLAVNAYFDHFYNRCIYYFPSPATKVNVPYNFQTWEGWEKTFAQHGLKTQEVVPLGVDHLIAPLFHTLHITEKR